MLNTNVSVDVRKLGQAACALDIHGEVNAAAEGPLMEAYAQASNAGARSILLNFAGLKFMNSSGIGLLVTLLIRIKRQNQRLMAYGLSDHYQQIFDMTRLNEAIGVCANEATALEMANGMYGLASDA